MAFGYFMNMEKLSLMIAEQHIENMTDNNYYDDLDVFLDPDRLTNNLANGFVVITQLSCFFESFLNTIINACMNYNGNALLKCSQEEKLDLIFMHYQKDFAEIRGQNPWAVHQKVTKVRNEMIHYKKTDIGMSTGIPDFQLGKQRVAEFFTKKTMGNVKDEYIKLTEKALKISPDKLENEATRKKSPAYYSTIKNKIIELVSQSSDKMMRLSLLKKECLKEHPDLLAAIFYKIVDRELPPNIVKISIDNKLYLKMEDEATSDKE